MISGAHLRSPQPNATPLLTTRTNRIVRWTEFDHGGHFAALEQPEPLVADFRQLRGTDSDPTGG